MASTEEFIRPLGLRGGHPAARCIVAPGAGASVREAPTVLAIELLAEPHAPQDTRHSGRARQQRSRARGHIIGQQFDVRRIGERRQRALIDQLEATVSEVREQAEWTEPFIGLRRVAALALQRHVLRQSTALQIADTQDVAPLDVDLQVHRHAVLGDDAAEAACRYHDGVALAPISRGHRTVERAPVGVPVRDPELALAVFSRDPHVQDLQSAIPDFLLEPTSRLFGELRIGLYGQDAVSLAKVEGSVVAVVHPDVVDQLSGHGFRRWRVGVRRRCAFSDAAPERRDEGSRRALAAQAARRTTSA